MQKRSKTNLPKEFYVYAYLRVNNSKIAKSGTPYYIGKGSKSRAWEPHKSIPLPTTNLRIVIVEKGLTEIGAFAIERRLIKWWGRKDNGTGILLNRTDGGEGLSGKIVTDEFRKKMSELSKGRTFSKETREKMAEAKRNESNETKKKRSVAATKRTRMPMSAETKLKISQANTGKTRTIESKLKMSQAATLRTLKENKWP